MSFSALHIALSSACSRCVSSISGIDSVSAVRISPSFFRISTRARSIPSATAMILLDAVLRAILTLAIVPTAARLPSLSSSFFPAACFFIKNRTIPSVPAALRTARAEEPSSISMCVYTPGKITLSSSTATGTSDRRFVT